MEAQRVLVLLVLAPVLEESIFRAGLQEWLLRRPLRPWAANLVTAACFALTHVAVRGDATAAAVAVPALAIGAIYQRGRRLRWCIVAHALMNGAWLILRSTGWGL